MLTGALTQRNPTVPIAAGEGSNTYRMAEDLITHGGIQFVQIDAGRIGGIMPSFQVRQLAEQHSIQYVNHTFKSHLSLAASTSCLRNKPRFRFIGVSGPRASELSQRLIAEPFPVEADGTVRVKDSAGTRCPCRYGSHPTLFSTSPDCGRN